MKKILFLFVILAIFSISTSAQVDNYCLKLDGQGYAITDNVAELDGLNTYSVQFWLNPTVWTPNATIFSRGSGDKLFAAKLGATSGEIKFFAGTSTIAVTSASIVVSKWTQITLANDNNSVKIYINNTLSKEITTNMTIPASSDLLTLGTSFIGRIDEFRLWNVALNFNYYLWRNTINKFHPQWNNLVLYYKFDQNLCPNIVDYTFKHHGSFSASGAVREKVTDNSAFKYRIQSAYTDFSRFADRAIDREKYLLSNDIIMLGVESNSDGTITMPYSDDHGAVVNGNYLNSYNGRNGVLALNGSGAQMTVGSKALTPDAKYAFQTWIYLENWAEGAFIFKKEASDTQGFSIRLGSAATYELIVRLNGHEYKRNVPTAVVANPVGSWWNLGVVAFSLDLGIAKTFMFTFNGKAYFPVSAGVPTTLETTLLPQGVAATTAIVGQNLNAKLDETVIWNTDLTEAQTKSYMTALPMPGFGKTIDAAGVMAKMNCNWSYDKAEDVGYDSYSYKHFMSIVRSAFDGYRGYKIRMSVKGHTGWETTFSSATKRVSLAQGIVQAAQEFDGIDLDFEWCYDGTCFNNYGLLLNEIGKIMPAEKVFTVSPHYVSYAIPTQYMTSVDYFNFQIYGPQPNMFKWSTYVDAYNRFIAQGYPKEKIIMSYATTTSKACDDAAGNIVTAAAPIGVRNGLLDGNYSPEMDVVMDSNSKYRFITGVNQTRDRSEYIHDKDLAGIMYWDMGNDVATSHQYSIPKASNFAIASNVDSIITHVDFAPNAIMSIWSNQKSGMTIFPNPVKNQIGFVLPQNENIDSIQVYNTSGQLILTKTNTVVNQKLNTSSLPQGYYTLRVTTHSGINYCNSFVKQ